MMFDMLGELNAFSTNAFQFAMSLFGFNHKINWGTVIEEKTGFWEFVPRMTVNNFWKDKRKSVISA
jgi:hypothetical protein